MAMKMFCDLCNREIPTHRRGQYPPLPNKEVTNFGKQGKAYTFLTTIGNVGMTVSVAVENPDYVCGQCVRRALANELNVILPEDQATAITEG